MIGRHEEMFHPGDETIIENKKLTQRDIEKSIHLFLLLWNIHLAFR